MELNFDDSDEDTVDFSPSNEEGRSADQSRLTVHDMYERLDSLQLLHEQNKRWKLSQFIAVKYAYKRFVSFLSNQRKLVCGQNLFTTLDRSSTCDFEFTLDSFRTDEVFCIEIIDTKYEVVSDPGFKSKRMSLEVSLFLQEDKSFELNSRRQLFSPIRNSLGNRNRPPLKPDSLVDGFTFALTTADISTGNYILSINNYGDSQQSVKICYSVHTRVFSTPISQGKVKGCVQSNEMHFFSVVLPNPQLLLTLRLQSRPPGDADLLVTNRFKGMVKLTRESAVWQSTLGGDEVLHIHPDDERTKAGNVFLIGVFGYKDGSSEYALEVIFSQPPPIKLLSSAMSNIDFSLAHGQIVYFALPINVSKKGSTLIVIGERSRIAVDDVLSADKLSVKRMRKSHTQHVILTSDSLFELGILEDAAVYRRLARNVPAIQPILYMSTTNMYPDAVNFSWRVLPFHYTCHQWIYDICVQASSSDGIAIAELYHQEFISLSSPPLMCYFSICCHHICRALQQDDECASPLSCKTTFTLRTLPFQKLETTSNNFAYEKKEEMENLYTMLESSCGAYISQRDRTAAHLMENASYTYCETDPASMCTLLHQCKLSDGLVFYDLGSGIGI